MLPKLACLSLLKLLDSPMRKVFATKPLIWEAKPWRGHLIQGTSRGAMTMESAWQMLSVASVENPKLSRKRDAIRGDSLATPRSTLNKAPSLNKRSFQ